MNKITRRLVNTTMVATLTLFAASAEPMSLPADSSGERPSKSALTLAEPLAPVSDVTRSSLSEGFTMTSPNVASVARKQEANISANGDGISLISPSNGKVLAVAALEVSTHVVRDTALAVPESEAEGGHTSTLADEVVAESSAAVSQMIEPSILSVATASADMTPIDAPVTINSTSNPQPEPSSLLLVGSIFVGCGLWRGKRSK
jgi:hypothetical protein